MRVFIYDSELMFKEVKPVLEEGHGIEVPDALIAEYRAAIETFYLAKQRFDDEVKVIQAEERMREKLRLQAALAERRKASLAKLKAMK